MRTNPRILLVVDAAVRRTPAFARATELALATGANLHLFLPVYSWPIHAWSLLARASGSASQKSFVDQRAHLLDLEISVLRQRQIRVFPAIEWTPDPVASMRREIGRLAPDFVVKDAEPARSFPAFGMGADGRLLRHCGAPLLLVKREPAQQCPRVAVAVGVDRNGRLDTEFNREMVNAAANLARAMGAELHCVHVDQDLQVVQPPLHHGHQPFHWSPPPIPPGPFEAFTAALSLPEVRCHRLPGRVAEALRSFVNTYWIDQLVIGHDGSRSQGSDSPASLSRMIRSDVGCDLLVWQTSQFLARNVHKGLKQKALAATTTRWSAGMD